MLFQDPPASRHDFASETKNEEISRYLKKKKSLDSSVAGSSCRRLGDAELLHSFQSNNESHFRLNETNLFCKTFASSSTGVPLNWLRNQFRRLPGSQITPPLQPKLKLLLAFYYLYAYLSHFSDASNIQETAVKYVDEWPPCWPLRADGRTDGRIDGEDGAVCWGFSETNLVWSPSKHSLTFRKKSSEPCPVTCKQCSVFRS